MYKCAEIFRRRSIVAGERGEAAQLAILDLNKTSRRDASAMEEGTVLERTRLLDTNVQTERCISDLF
jgi:hypothetical protein